MEKQYKIDDLVVMCNCGEADHYKGTLWTCLSDSYFDRAGQEVVFLKGFSGCFLCEYLQIVYLPDPKPVNTDELEERIIQIMRSIEGKMVADDEDVSIEDVTKETAKAIVSLINQVKENIDLKSIEAKIDDALENHPPQPDQVKEEDLQISEDRIREMVYEWTFNGAFGGKTTIYKAGIKAAIKELNK